jgi:tetratricopeptide (TPR) repeat protein
VTTRRALALPLLLAAAAPAARADEIRWRDPQTCETKTEKVAEVVAETWVEVSARTKERGGVDKRIPARLIVDIVRPADDAQATRFAEAVGDLLRGRFAEARSGFAAISGGGPKVTEQGQRVFVPFNASDVPGKAPKWHAEYAHYYYAEAAWREAVRRGRDKQGLEEALRALVADEPAPKPDPKDKEKKDPPVGEKGFLARFAVGKSRFYPDAMLLKARVLQDLGRSDEALKAYDELYAKAIELPIGARWAYEAKVGPGRLAEARGAAADAETAYEAAAQALEQLIATAPDPCTRRDYGRYYNEAGIQKARVLLEAAEKAASPPAFARLQEYLRTRTPDALATRFRTRPHDVVSAVVEGAGAPSVQAVLQNGLGLALLHQGKHAEAVFAFTEVRVKHFGEADEVPRALHYLAKAADAAAAASKGEAKALFEQTAAGARKELETSWADSPWAK